MPADMDLFRPGIDTRLLLEEINGYLLSCCWKMFLTGGGLDPDFLEKDFLKRVGQWKSQYPLSMKTEGLTPEKVIRAINHTFDNAIIATDVGQNQLWANSSWN